MHWIEEPGVSSAQVTMSVLCLWKILVFSFGFQAFLSGICCSAGNTWTVNQLSKEGMTSKRLNLFIYLIPQFTTINSFCRNVILTKKKTSKVSKIALLKLLNATMFFMLHFFRWSLIAASSVCLLLHIMQEYY